MEAAIEKWIDNTANQEPSSSVAPVPTASRHQARWVRPALLVVFALIAAQPMLDRLRHPTLVGDDEIRLVNLIEHPLSRLLFRPFNEHVAPCVELVSWATWQLCGQDIRVAPLGFCIASVLPWALLLVTFGVWLKRETGSEIAALASVAVVAQSPFALEVMWYYSASTFTWSILGIVVAVEGARQLRGGGRRGLVLVALGSGMGPAFCTVGVLAAPLAMLRAAIDPSIVVRRKIAAAATAVLAFGGYMFLCDLAAAGLSHRVPGGNLEMKPVDVLSGLAYSLAVPGQILWPSLVGIRPSQTARIDSRALCAALGLLALGLTLACGLRARRTPERILVGLGAAMIYLGYALTYCGRASFVRQGLWTDEALLYLQGNRYHALPLLGMGVILAALARSVPWLRTIGNRPLRPVLVGIGVGLLALLLNRPELAVWSWMLKLPDQGVTLNALHHLGEVAQREGIDRDQLGRILLPVVRRWNSENPFQITRLASLAPSTSGHTLSDEEARTLVLERLTPSERFALGAGACVSVDPLRLPEGSHSLNTARLAAVHGLTEIRPGEYQVLSLPAFLEYEVDIPADARYLELTDLESDENFQIQWRGKTRRWSFWNQVKWWGKQTTANPARPAVIDIQRLVNRPTEPVARIRVAFTSETQTAVVGQPRVLR